MSATIVYAVRHGETEWNVAGIQQGHLDTPLTPSGELQAASVAEGLADRGIEAIYSSDLGRALTTARIIGDRIGLPVKSDARLRERHLGVMQGITQAQFRERFPDEFAKYATHDPDYRFPGGESARERYERNVAGCDGIAERHPGGTILIVSHGGVLNSMFTHALGLDIAGKRRFSLFNAAINRFSVDSGGWRLETWGELAHIRGEPVRDDT